MEEYEFYDNVDMRKLRIGDKFGKLKLSVLIDITEENNCKKFTATYKGKQFDKLTNQYVFSLKENIKMLDYKEFLRNRDKLIDDAMRYEINCFVN